MIFGSGEREHVREREKEKGGGAALKQANFLILKKLK
jgi:hypothetical protein